MNFLHPRHHFDFAGIEIVGNSDTAENRLALSGRAVNFKAEMDQLIDHLLDLIFTGRILHCDNHEFARLPVRGMPECQRLRRSVAIPRISNFGAVFSVSVFGAINVAGSESGTISCF